MALPRPPGGASGVGRWLRTSGARHIWPLTSICLAMPAWFVVGGSAIPWALPAVVLGFDLLRRRAVRLPAGAPFVLALLAWIALSGIQLRAVPALALFAYRFSLFASLAVLYIWICHVSPRLVPTRTLVELLAGLWLVLVAFGYVAFALPGFESSSPIQALLPGALRGDPYVRDLTSIRFAETQGFLGYVVPRPSAPMTYANGWGSTLGLLTPFFVLAWLVDASRRRRQVGAVLLLLGLVPAVVSLNRGLWISAAMALAYVAARAGLGGDRRMAGRLLGTGLVVLAVVVMTPLWAFVGDKLSGADAGDATRASAYEEAVEHSLRSPFLGYGAPVSSEDLPVAVGTHGLLWYLMVSHGFPAVACFALWLGGVVRRGLALTTPTGLWATAAIVVFAMQVPIYGLLPQAALAGVVAAIIWREGRQK